MKIAVNTRFLLNDYLEGYGYFVQETFKRIIIDHPEHEFLFIFDRPYDQRFVFGPNVKAVVAGPPARHPLLWKWWYDVKLPALLRKYKADIFVSCDGFCSLRTRVPQCLVLHDLAFLHYPSFIRKSHLLYYKKYTPKMLARAKAVATVSAFSKNDIIQQYKTEENKIDVVYSASKDIFRPLTDSEKKATKTKYTEGKDYFIYTGAIHPRKNLVNLLKAFSLFKKRQQSSLKLVLAGRLAWKYDSFIKDLQTYKYRNDVVLPGYVAEEEIARLTGAAYAMVYPSYFEGFGVPVLEAMQCHVPVIISEKTSMQEIAGGAALLADPADPAAIAAQMMLLYKDEKLRKQLTEKGKETAAGFSWDRTARLLWQSIEKAIPQNS
ncbi:MAG TPA: glycosyltransferase family 1 protein [Chitinophagaceae bacterium]|nr:glycosyltransferase family 1 protein [Chitinophagaceae bacterium]